jgi:hypothetical protein
MGAYALTIGGVLHQGANDAVDLERARQLLDERDESHLQQFGHLPGEEPGCSLTGYDRALALAVAGVRAERRGAMVEGTTAQVSAELNRRAPWLNTTVGVDPVMAAAQAELAAKIAGLQVSP